MKVQSIPGRRAGWQMFLWLARFNRNFSSWKSWCGRYLSRSSISIHVNRFMLNSTCPPRSGVKKSLEQMFVLHMHSTFPHYDNDDNALLTCPRGLRWYQLVSICLSMHCGWKFNMMDHGLRPFESSQLRSRRQCNEWIELLFFMPKNSERFN